MPTKDEALAALGELAFGAHYGTISDDKIMARVALITKHIESAGADAWQAIETAPRDGLFIGWAPPPDGDPQIIHGKTYWSSIVDGAPKYLPIKECLALTHWRPLPAPPAIDAARTKESQDGN